MEYQQVTHTFLPVWDAHTKVLILGSFPSVKSREMQFYYGHPQNRFWKMLAGVFGVPEPRTIEEKKALLLQEGVGLWDVIASCEIRGSSDSSIRNVVPADLAGLLQKAPVEKILANGATAHKLYQKYAEPLTGMAAVKMPSTSPANAAWSLERLVTAWKEELQEGL